MLSSASILSNRAMACGANFGAMQSMEDEKNPRNPSSKRSEIQAESANHFQTSGKGNQAGARRLGSMQPDQGVCRPAGASAPSM